MKVLVRASWGASMFGLLLLYTAILGCKSTGEGMGQSPTGDIKATFTWEETGPTKGTLKATVIQLDGMQQQYQGTFYQITKDTQMETIAPLWSPWWPAWGGWAYWGPEPTDSFITQYTGHVVANLASPDGKHMRCHFRLLRSSEGMKGGGEGECQLPSGQTIKADFAPA
ncbi:MAG: hypothetical protein WAU56_13260 [Steroidobacteraceae bacterium]